MFCCVILQIKFSALGIRIKYRDGGRHVYDQWTLTNEKMMHLYIHTILVLKKGCLDSGGSHCKSCESKCFNATICLDGGVS